MISSDRNIFREGSDVRERMRMLGEQVTLSIIVFSQKRSALRTTKLSDTVTAYPTNSFSRFLYMRDASNVARRELTDYPDIDLITAQDPFETGFVAWRLSRRFNKKFQLQIHTDLFSPYFVRSLLQMIRVRVARFLLPRADAIRVVSERIKESLKTFRLKISPEVLPVFVDVQKFASVPVTIDLHKKYRQFSFIILMASRLSPEKDIPLALVAVDKIRHHYPKLGLVIVGSGEEKQRLARIVREKNLEENVVFEHWQDNLTSYFKTADLFLLTSRFEGFANTLVEAVAAGCPVVSTDVGVAPLLYPLRHDLYLCPVGDVSCITQKILNQLNSTQSRDDFTLNAKTSLSQITVLTRKEYVEQQARQWQKIIV